MEGTIKKQSELSKLGEATRLVEANIDTLVHDITEIASAILKQHAKQSGEESLEVVRVS